MREGSGPTSTRKIRKRRSRGEEYKKKNVKEAEKWVEFIHAKSGRSLRYISAIFLGFSAKF